MSDKPNRQAEYIQERDEIISARETAARLKAITIMHCEYATNYRAKLLRECDERNKV